MSNQTSRLIKTIGTLTISNGQQASNILLAKDFAHFQDIAFFGPATLSETVNVQYSAADKAVADYVDADFVTDESPPGTDVVVNQAGRTTSDRPIGYALRLYATTAVSGDKVFTVLGRAPLQH